MNGQTLFFSIDSIENEQSIKKEERPQFISSIISIEHWNEWTKPASLSETTFNCSFWNEKDKQTLFRFNGWLKWQADIVAFSIQIKQQIRPPVSIHN